VLAVFLLTALLWVFRTDITLGFVDIPGWSNRLPESVSLDDGTVAIIMALLLFFIPTRSTNARTNSATIVDATVFRQLPWGVIILFGGGFTLAKGFEESGLATYLGSQLTGLAAFSPLVMVTSINFAMTFLTELTSNTATTQMILPVLASLGVAVAENPMLLMIPATLSASCAFMLPVATPPNAIVFGSERVRIWEMVKAGLFLNFIGIAVVTGVVFLWGTVAFDITPGVQPQWAKITVEEPAAAQSPAEALSEQPLVVIDAPLPSTGNSAEPAEMAADVMNAQGEINGRPTPVYGDGQANPEVDQPVVEDLAVNPKPN
jgi:sodium-dependent dicarboxylate transporter 2/3/5